MFTSLHCQHRPQGIPALYRPTQVTCQIFRGIFKDKGGKVESPRTFFDLLAESPELLHLGSPGRTVELPAPEPAFQDSSLPGNLGVAAVVKCLKNVKFVDAVPLELCHDYIHVDVVEIYFFAARNPH